MVDDTVPRRPQLIILSVALILALTLIVVSFEAEGDLQIVLRATAVLLMPLAGIVYPLYLWRQRKSAKHPPG